MKHKLFLLAGSMVPLLASDTSIGEMTSSLLPHVIGFSLFTGIFLTLFVHNCTLYIATKERDYLFYTLSICTLFIFALFFQGHHIFPFTYHSNIDTSIKILSFQASIGFLVVFSLHFLNIKTLSPALYRIAGIVTLFAILLALLGFFYFREPLCILTFLLSLSFFFFLGFFAISHHSDLATYYLIGLGGLVMGALGAFLGSLGALPNFPWHDLLLIAGIAWQMLVFSMALSRKIRLLSIEHAKAMMQIKTQNKMLFLQSRYTSVGELIRNITHQWKEPLGEIGAIQSNLKSSLVLQGNITKEKLTHAIDLSHHIITHLAQTIDTFYSFFKSQANEQYEFNAVKTIEDIQKMVNYTFKTEHIALVYEPQESHIFLLGNPNEFSHAILNLILNAKDILIQRQVSNPTVHVNISQTTNHVLVTVEDNGGGITQTPIASIFNIGTTSHEENIGLGLFITKTIVEQKMQGSIEVQNTHQGAYFSLLFPHHTYEIPQEDLHMLFDIEASTISRISHLEKDIKHHIEVEKNLRHWAQIFEKANWGIAIYEAHSKTLTLMNPALRTLYGYDEEELSHQPLALLFSQDWQEKLEGIFHTVHRTGQHTFEAIHRKKEGEHFPVEVDIIAVKEEEYHSFLYYIVNIRDLTHYKKTHQRLLLKTFALEHIHEGVFLIDHNSHFQYVNQEACRYLGYSRAELLQMRVKDIDPVFPSHKWSEHWEELKKQKIITLESTHRHKDGTLFPIEIVSNYMEYDGISFNMAMVRNITERRLLEAKKQDEQTKLFFERQFVGMAISSPNKQWLKVNDKLCDMLGYTREELLLKTWEEITYPDENLIQDNMQFERVLQGELDAFSLKKYYIHKQGHLITVEILTQCVRSENGEVEFFLTHVQDITEKEAIVAERLAKNRKLKELLEFNQSIINAIPDLLFEITPEGIYQNIWGRNDALLLDTKEKLLNKSIYDVLPKEALEVSLKTMEEVDKKGFSLGNYYALDLPDGKRWFELSVVKKQSDEHYLALVRDISERKNAQEELANLNKELENRIEQRTAELQEALAFNQGIINAIPDLLFELDSKGNYLNIWTQNEALLVKDKAQLLHKNISDFLPTEASRVIYDGLDEARKKGYSFGKSILLVLEGKEHWFELSISNKTLSDSFIVLSREITQRRETEIALMKSEEAFRAIVENSPDVIARYDLECHRVYVNPQMRLLLNRPYEALLGKTPDTLSPLLDVATFKKHFFQTIQTKQECVLEIPFLTHVPPKERWGFIRLIPELDASKNVISVLLIGHDITEEKTTKEGLLLLQTAIDHMKEALFVTDNEGIIVFINTLACQMLGYTQEELIGHHVSTIDTSISSEELLAIAQDPELNKTIILHTQHTTKQGEKLNVEIQGTRFCFNNCYYGISIAKRYTPEVK